MMPYLLSTCAFKSMIKVHLAQKHTMQGFTCSVKPLLLALPNSLVLIQKLATLVEKGGVVLQHLQVGEHTGLTSNSPGWDCPTTSIKFRIHIRHTSESVITGMLTAGNLISNNSFLLGTCGLNPQKSRQALQELVLALLLEPACKRCWTRCVGGEDGLFH